MAKSRFWALIALTLLMVVSVGLVHASTGAALGVNVTDVEANGDSLTPDEITRTSIERDGTLNVEVTLQSNVNTTLHDVEVTAFIVGYEYNDLKDEQLSDTSEPFDVDSAVVYTKKLQLKLPQLLETDNYKLRIIVADRYGAAQIYNYNLKMDAPSHGLAIRDVIFSPDGNVQAGRALLAVARIKNVGDGTESGIKIKVEIPALGVSASQYIDELDADKSISSEELYLKIPACAKEGDYAVKTTVTYDEGHATETKNSMIHVSADGACVIKPSSDANDKPSTPSTPTPVVPAKEPKLIVSVGPSSQIISRGEGGAIYQVTMSNEGSAAKTYTLSVDGTDGWAVTRVSPSAIVSLQAGEQKSVYVYVTAKENAQAGTHMFALTLKAEETVKQIPLSAEVTDSAGTSSDALKSGLEIGVIVLLVLLVIVALIVGFNRMRGKKEDQELTQTYY